MRTQIAEAVEPLRIAAQDRAEEFARTHVRCLLEELEAAGGDANVCAPYPSSFNCSRAAYHVAVAKYKLVRQLTRSTTNRSLSPRDPDMRVADAAGIEKFVQEAREDADQQYSAFIAKLEEKVGAHTAATLTGNHVWSFSVLTVETPTGTQRWKTQQILNVSKLGKVFNQWPTRLVK